MAFGGIRRLGSAAVVVMAYAVLWTSSATASPSLTVSGLKTNGLSEPLGIGDGGTRLQLEARRRRPGGQAGGLRDPGRRLGVPARLRPPPVAVREGRVVPSVGRRLGWTAARVAAAGGLAGEGVGRGG